MNISIRIYARRIFGVPAGALRSAFTGEAASHTLTHDDLLMSDWRESEWEPRFSTECRQPNAWQYFVRDYVTHVFEHIVQCRVCRRLLLSARIITGTHAAFMRGVRANPSVTFHVQWIGSDWAEYGEIGLQLKSISCLRACAFTCLSMSNDTNLLQLPPQSPLMHSSLHVTQPDSA